MKQTKQDKSKTKAKNSFSFDKDSNFKMQGQAFRSFLAENGITLEDWSKKRVLTEEEIERELANA